MAKAMDLFAAMPAVVAYDQRRRHGQDAVEPRDDLGYSANFLWMTFGEEQVPEVVEAFNVSMILYAEHSFNASTFTARVITSTLVGPALGGHRRHRRAEGPAARRRERGRDAHLRRDRHPPGGVPGGGRTPGPRPGWRTPWRTKKKVMGFGHRVYKHGDSRVPTMKAALDKMIAHYGRPELLGLYNGLEPPWTRPRPSSPTSTTRPAPPTT